MNGCYGFPLLLQSSRLERVRRKGVGRDDERRSDDDCRKRVASYNKMVGRTSREVITRRGSWNHFFFFEIVTR